MNEHQADQVVTLIKASVGGRVDPSSTDYFMARLNQMDYQSALSAATTGSTVWRFFPSWAEFYEHYRLQEKLKEPVGEQRDELPPRKYEIPFWVKCFIAARFLYARFGKERDLRPFREQQPYVDPTAEFMPEGEWAIEAERVSDRDVWGALA